MERDYIDALNHAYDDYFVHSETDRPVLVIDSNDLDFVHRQEDLDWVDNRIRQQLKLPPFQIELPMPGEGAE
jgi:deoxyadenosine/deoxycytidine kinase